MASGSAHLSRLTSFAVWGGLSCLYALLLASGLLLPALAVLALLIGVVVFQFGSRSHVFIWLVGAPTIFSIPNKVLSAFPLLSVERLLFLMLVGSIFLNMVFKKERYARLSFMEVLMLGFLIYALASLMAVTTPWSLRKDLWFYMQYVIPMTLFLIVRRLSWTQRDVELLFACLTAAGIFLSLVGILQLHLGITLFVPNEASLHAGERAVGSFSNAVAYSGTLSSFLLLTALQLTWYRERLIRTFLLGAILLMGVAIIAAKSRAPALGLLAGLAIIFLRDRSVRPLMLSAVPLVLLSAPIIWLVAHDDFGLSARVSNVDTVHSRIINWVAALNMLFAKPLFGFGFGFYVYYSERHDFMTSVGGILPHAGTYLGDPHNEILHIGVMLGLLGIALMIWICTLLFRQLLQNHIDKRLTPRQRQISIYVFAIGSGLIINGMFATLYAFSYMLALVFCLVGIVFNFSSCFSMDDRGRSRRHL